MPSYDTQLKARYSGDYMPWWRELADAMLDRSVRELWVLKNSRAGCTENTILAPMRYAVANGGKQMLYVSATLGTLEKFAEKRIKAGFMLANKTASAYRQARVREYEVFFPNCDLILSVAGATGGYKQSGYEWIFLDELSTYPGFAADVYRKRGENYAFSKIVGISSPDAAQKRGSDEDPIFIEYRRGDCRKWTCTDPATGNPFVFSMGTRDGWGLRWNQDAKLDNGEWDLKRLKAWFVTPDGTTIEEADRMNILRAGRWEPTNVNHAPGVRSYHVNNFVSPFSSFRDIAEAFLKAKAAGSMALRTFIYEWLAEPYYEKIDQPSIEAITSRESDYRRGSRPDLPEGSTPVVIIGADVQKTHIWWVARVFWGDGNSALIDYGASPTFDELDAVARKYDASRVMIDAQYRKAEVYEAAHRYTFVPVEGHDRLSMPYLFSQIDPFEGTRGQGDNSIPLFKLDVDVFRTILLDCIRGESARKWSIPRGLPLEYQRQIMSMRKVDGQWVQKGQDHLFDCETYAVAGAVWSGAYRLL